MNVDGMCGRELRSYEKSFIVCPAYLLAKS